MTVTDGSGQATFSDYSFRSDVEWTANLRNGDYADAVVCGLYNQDGEFVGEGGNDGNQGAEDPEPVEENPETPFLTRFESDTDFTFWSCAESEPVNRFSFTISKSADDENIGVLSINGGDAVQVAWQADRTNFVLSDSAGNTATFNGYSFGSATEWNADLSLSWADYNQPVICQLFDQDGNPVN